MPGCSGLWLKKKSSVVIDLKSVYQEDKFDQEHQVILLVQSIFQCRRITNFTILRLGMTLLIR